MAIDIDAIIAAVQAAQLLKDKDTKAAPQSFDPLLSKFVPLLSDNGAARQVLYGPDGQPISIVDNKLAVKAAELEEKLEAVRVLLNTLAGKDFATQTTLAQILEKMIANPATEAKQDSLATLVGAIEDKLNGVIDGTTPATTISTGSEVMQNPPVVGERTVTATAAEMHAGASPLAGRYEMVVLNTSANTVYWGPTGVTLGTGFPLLPNDVAHFKFSTETHIPIFFIADGNFVVKVVELS